MKQLLARKFNALIELWENESTSDGYGGVTISANLVGSIFARREELRKENYTAEAVVFDKGDLAFVIRKREINTNENFIVFNGSRYTILRIENTQLETQMRLICLSTNKAEPIPSV
jgi:head-tail adaptor